MGIILEGNFVNMISSSSNSLEKNQNEEKYIDYIETHREKVKASYEKYFLPLLDKEDLELTKCSVEEFKQAIRDAINNIECHDESKYSDIEFNPYRLRFYPTEEEKIALEDGDAKIQQQTDFEAAWEHHYKNNPHHPMYWVQEDGTILDMELKYIVEMFCDWMSFGDDIRVWYQNKAIKEKEAMSTRTREIVEELLGIIYQD